MGKRKLSNRFWFQLHGWFSLPVWVLFFFVSLTGTIAVISHELTWLTNPAARAVNPDELPQKNAAQLVSLFKEQYPSAQVTGFIAAEDYLVRSVVFTDKNVPFAQAYINQYTGEIQAIETGITFIGFMRSLHGWLLFPWQNGYSIGYYLVGLMSIVVLGALVTGLVVYKKFWRALFSPKLRFNQGVRTTLVDLHKMGGVWSIWFLALMGITGLWYLIQGVLWHTETEFEAYPEPLAVSELPLPGESSGEPEVTFSKALSIAKQTYPDFSPSYIMLPEHNRDTYKLSGGGEFIFFDNYSYRVTINPWNSEVVEQFAPADMGALQTVMHIADPLHYGTIGGLATKLIWFVFGLILSGMSLSGFYMWYLRLIGKRKSKLSQQAIIQPGGIINESN